MKVSRLIVATVTAFAAMIPVASHAAAGRLEGFSYHDDVHFVANDVCGVTGLSVTFDVVVDGRVLGVIRGSGPFPFYTITQHGWALITNLANGKSMTTTWNTIGKDQSITDNGDGTITIVEGSAGQFRFVDTDGRLVGVNAGTIWSQYVVDYAGTPSDPSDDTFVAFLGETKFVGHEDSNHNDTCPMLLSVIG